MTCHFPPHLLILSTGRPERRSYFVLERRESLVYFAYSLLILFLLISFTLYLNYFITLLWCIPPKNRACIFLYLLVQDKLLSILKVLGNLFQKCIKLSCFFFKGSADPLNSAFHLTYNMVLNLLRVEEINPEYMLEKSFYQFQHYRAIPGVVESKCEVSCV